MARAALATVLALAPLGVVVACGASAPRKAVVAPLVVADAAPAADVADATADAFVVEAPLLPSGEYEVVTEVVKDTCGAVPPPPATMFVPMKIWHEKVTGNFPLPLPRKGGFGSARSDITLSPAPPPKPVTLRGLGSQCPDYETKTRYEVVERSSDRVRISYARDYGDASTCRTKAPSNCVLDYVYTFRLVRKVCDPQCGVTFVRAKDATAEPRCDCPDSGAP